MARPDFCSGQWVRLLKAKIGWGPHVNKLTTFLLKIPAQLPTEVKPKVHWLARFLTWKMACLEI